MANQTGDERAQRELELQRWDKEQPALLAVQGVNDTLVASLPLKAERKGGFQSTVPCKSQSVLVLVKLGLLGLRSTVP